MCLIFPNRNQNWLTRQYFIFLYTFSPLYYQEILLYHKIMEKYFMYKKKKKREKEALRKKIDYLKKIKINYATKLIYFIINKILTNKIDENYAFTKRRLFN